MPGLPALTELSPIIQQAAGNPEQATQLLMAAAQAFSHSPSAPEESKNVAASVNQFVQAPDAASTAHVVPPGVEPGTQAHLPTGVDPVQRRGPRARPQHRPPAPANAVPVAATPSFPKAAQHRRQLPAPAPDGRRSGLRPRTPPPTQDFMYPSISNNSQEQTAAP